MTMCKLVFVFAVFVLATPGYSISQSKLDQLKALIGSLEGATTTAAPVTCATEAPAPAAVPCNDKMTELETRLADMEDQMDEIIRYLSGEKETDKVLKVRSDEVIAKMEAKEQETENIIEELDEEVFFTLDDLEMMIEEVNKSAQVTINSKGVIFYGHVGSPCSTYSDDCLDAHAQCRSGKCQCDPGYSFDVTGKKCVETCAKYGSTYQTVSRNIIRGHNKHILNGTDVDARQCKTWCTEATDFVCKSIDYFPRWDMCFFSDMTMLEVDEDDVEYSSVGVHFQRDCE